jgi:hypothetical protein
MLQLYSVKQFEIEKHKALMKARSMIVTATCFDDIARIVLPYYGTEMLIDLLHEFEQLNIYYNSPLTKALDEE